jgi:DeoR family transcriptional regulator, glycerol-3-phosphate regulon repressor
LWIFAGFCDDLLGDKAMNVPTRWQSAILDALRLTGRESVTALAERLNVSDETVRRHLKDLVEQGAVHRVHGSVVLAGALAEPPFSRRMKDRIAAKRAIGKAVAERVVDGMTLLIDSGSTTTYVAEALQHKTGLTVVTNSIEVARTLLGRSDCVVQLAGGTLRADVGAAVGQEAIALINEFRADLAILSIGAIDAKHGYMDFDVDEARVARAMLEQSEKTIVAADAWKFTAKARVRVCGFEPIATLVTDQPPPISLRKTLNAAGTETIVATVSETSSKP